MPPRLFFSLWDAPLDAARRLLWAVTAAAVAGSLAAAAWVLDAAASPSSWLPPLSGTLAAVVGSPSLSFSPRSLFLTLAAVSAFFAAASRLGLLDKETPVYMRDLSVWKPLESWKMSTKDLVHHMRLSGLFLDPSSVDFVEKVMKSAGFAPSTRMALSPGILKMRSPPSRKQGDPPPPPPNHDDAVLESEEIISSVVDDLLLKTGVRADEIDVVITTCSLFAPVPSLGAQIVNRFRMRADVLTASLAGAGCGGNVVAIDLAARVLRSLPRSTKGRFAVVVCTENITNNWYTGNDKSMLLCNAIFRSGGAACLLTTEGKDSNKYRLVATERTHLGRDNAAFRCMGQAFDRASSSLGVYLKRNVGEVASKAVRLNLERLGSRVLPPTELAKVALSRALLAVGGGCINRKKNGKLPTPYQPDFERSFAQVYPHAGGPAVLDAMQKSLAISEDKMKPSRAVWARFGNLSSASTLYAMAFAEAQPRGIKKGDRSLVIGLGGCFKAGTICWEAERDIREVHEAWA